MPFPEAFKQKELDQADECGICTEPCPPGGYLEVHSATSLHLVLDENNPTKYVVTDPPPGHDILKGRKLSLRVYPEGKTDRGDAVCLCPVCHDEIHRIALAEAKLLDKKFKGKIAPPKILHEATIHFATRKRPIVYDEVNY